MKKFLLQKKIYFTIEFYKKRLRLVVYQNKEEWVCRKETIKNLQEFLQLKEARIFKGRLQLYKIRNKIHVEVKGEVVGVISATAFQQLIPKPL
jgi:hypothetical protein